MVTYMTIEIWNNLCCPLCNYFNYRRCVFYHDCCTFFIHHCTNCLVVTYVKRQSDCRKLKDVTSISKFMLLGYHSYEPTEKLQVMVVISFFDGSLGWGFPGSSAGKESACSAGDSVRFLGREDHLEKGQAPYYSWASLVGSDDKESTVMWRPGLDPWVGKILWRKVWQPTPVFLPGESPWAEEPGGLQSMGSRRVTHE